MINLLKKIIWYWNYFKNNTIYFLISSLKKSNSFDFLFFRSGADVFHAGISTHAVNTKDAANLQEELLSLAVNSKVVSFNKKKGKKSRQYFTIATRKPGVSEEAR